MTCVDVEAFWDRRNAAPFSLSYSIDHGGFWREWSLTKNERTIQKARADHAHTRPGGRAGAQMFDPCDQKPVALSTIE